jgi:hypothetical protein
MVRETAASSCSTSSTGRGSSITRTGTSTLIDPTVYDDNGTAIRSVLVSRHFFADYSRVTVNRLFVDFESGVGIVSGQGSDPQVMLRVSRDGGHTWGNEIRASMGKMGEYGRCAEFRRLGTATRLRLRARDH